MSDNLHGSRLAAATILAAGLVMFPDSVQEAQANPCAENEVNQNPENRCL
jgi:hypothetical protein